MTERKAMRRPRRSVERDLPIELVQWFRGELPHSWVAVLEPEKLLERWQAWLKANPGAVEPAELYELIELGQKFRAKGER